MNITGYSTDSQKDKIVDDYKNSLAIKAKLNDLYEDANLETSKNKRLNISPVIKPTTGEEETKDIFYQTELAIKNLRGMLKNDDASNVLMRLRDADELVIFNRFFNIFEKDVGKQVNLTPSAFIQLWERYKEKLLASGTTGIFIPSQKADIDALVGKIDTLITSSGLTDAEVKKTSDMVEFLYESGMNKQIEAIYKMLNTKKEYERLVRENKLEREDIAREKKKWKADVDGVLNGLIEAENEAKTNREPNRFAILNEYENVVKEIDDNQSQLFIIDNKFTDIATQYEIGEINDSQFNTAYEKLNKEREKIKKQYEKKVYDEIIFGPKTEPKPTTAEKRLAQKERAKETRLRREEEQKEESIYKSKKEKERLRRKQEQELSEEALLEKVYEESGAKARAEQKSKAKKLAKTMKGLKEQSYMDIEKARLSRTAQNKFKNVIDELNKIIETGGNDLLNFKEAENILQNSPINSRRTSEQLGSYLNTTVNDLIDQMIVPDTETEQKKAEEVINDKTSDIVTDIMLKELKALETIKDENLGEAKSQTEADKIIEDVENLQQETISYYTALMRQIEEDGKKKILALSSSSERVFKGALKAGEVEKLEKELDNLTIDDLEKRAREVLRRVNSYANPTYALVNEAQTFKAKTNKRNKLIAYIIFHLTGQIIQQRKQKGGRIYKGKGISPTQDKYYEFGNYLLYVPHLEKGFLSLKYPSGAPIKDFPKTVISSHFINLLNEIVDTKKFNVEEYEKLEDNEKELFDRVITHAKLSRSEVNGIARHRKITDKQRDTDISRFNLLRGQIIAGNDNPNMMKEFKNLLIKLYNDKIISKSDFNKTMQTLVYLA